MLSSFSCRVESSPPPGSASAAGPALAPTMQTHNPTTEMATAAAVEADDAETVTKTGDKSPPNVLGWIWVNASSDTDDASENFESSIHESPSASDVRSPTITLTRRQELELSDRLGSADTEASYVLGVFEACMISVSFMLVLSSPLLLRHLYSEPLDLLRAIATFISAYIIFVIFIFSPKMCQSTVFFHVPCAVLLAIAADRFVGPYAGFLVMHMATGWLASLLGYAYGQLTQHIGRKMTATPLALTEEDKRTFKEARGPAAATFGVLSVLMVMAGAFPFWFFPEDAFSISLAFLTITEGGAILCWVVYVARFMLYDALFSPGQLGYITLCYIFPNVLIGYLLLMLSYFYRITDTIGPTFLWCLMLVIAGLLGYELSVLSRAAEGRTKGAADQGHRSGEEDCTVLSSAKREDAWTGREQVDSVYKLKFSTVAEARSPAVLLG